MPTIIILDVSLSMTKPICNNDERKITSPKHLAINGINSFLDYTSSLTKLEFISLVAFSSLYEERCSFTRDYSRIKAELQNTDDYDKTCVQTALHGINQIVLGEWGNNTLCQILLVTDGCIGVGHSALRQTLQTFNQKTTQSVLSPFSFPAKLHVVCITNPNDPCFIKSKSLYQRLVDLSGYDGSILVPDQLTDSSIISLFHKLAEEMYTSFNAVLKCGNLESNVVLSPLPVHYTKTTDFDCKTYSMSKLIEVCGFISVNDISSPMAVGRHLILPVGFQTKGKKTELSIDLTTEEDTTDESKIPSFCVLLHGALKVENMAALVTIGENWFGFIYSWADSKKKSNLMLTSLKPGLDAVPWLGDLSYLGCAGQFEQYLNFPVRPADKRSYSQNGVVWIKSAGLQSDIQKILRHARKLPDKTQQFYKELNRLRKAAISIGFPNLLTTLAAIFEQECLQLPSNAHPDCAVQLQHAVDVLKKTQNRDAKFIITAYQANYNV